MYRYEDDYGAILMRPAYEEQVRAFAEQYLPSEGIKIYTEIKNGGSNRINVVITNLQPTFRRRK